MTIEKMNRNSYGEIINLGNEEELLASAQHLIKKAVSKKKIPASFDTIKRDRKGRFEGEALHHELYDIAPSGKKALVCVRETEGSKYGVATRSKKYYIIRAHGTGTVVSEANKAVAAKAAKAAGNMIGYALAVVEGKEKLKVKNSLSETRTGYKALTTDNEGNLVSCWDGSAWPLGKCRIEKATGNHQGGFYYYKTLDHVLEAAAKNEIFGELREHKNLVIAKVEVSGREENVTATKICATKIKPVEIVAAAI
jgi:hypothetical protein